MKFPKGRAVLSNAKLEFVHLDNILADNKKERASKISGYMEIVYPDAVEFLYLKHGDPVNAAHFSRTERKQLSITEVIDKAKGTTVGTVSIYETPDELIDMILATFSVKAAVKNLDLTQMDPDKLFEKLQGGKFDGFVELRRGFDISYLRFKQGAPSSGYFTWKVESLAVDALTAALKAVATAPGALVVDIFDKLPEQAEQATPAQIGMYVSAFNKLVAELQGIATPTLVSKTLASSQDAAAAHFPFLKEFGLNGEIQTADKVVATPDELGRAFAEWVDVFVDSFRMVLGKRLDAIVQSAFKDFRFALKASSFGRHSKLKDLL
jgi:hypothetical protein